MPADRHGLSPPRRDDLGFLQRPAPDTNFSVTPDGSVVVYKANDRSLGFIQLDPVSNHYGIGWITTESVGGMVRVCDSGGVIFYLGTDGYLHQVYYEAGWHSRIIHTASGPISFSGPFDITPDCTKDSAQVYFQGADGFLRVAYVLGGAWVVNSMDCWSEPLDWQCRDAHEPIKTAYIRYAHGTVIYDGVQNKDWAYYNFRAYYYGKCSGDEV